MVLILGHKHGFCLIQFQANFILNMNQDKI